RGRHRQPTIPKAGHRGDANGRSTPRYQPGSRIFHVHCILRCWLRASPWRQLGIRHAATQINQAAGGLSLDQSLQTLTQYGATFVGTGRFQSPGHQVVVNSDGSAHDNKSSSSRASILALFDWIFDDLTPPAIHATPSSTICALIMASNCCLTCSVKSSCMA